ncbi:phosphatase PAP2 family protein [Bacterioplanoides sp.]|uniref:phosphatase PAP2 family protein n=1 Tax=Bacterioplanoides sp. TaxID=2066072 RepID=UPI003B000353
MTNSSTANTSFILSIAGLMLAVALFIVFNNSNQAWFLSWNQAGSQLPDLIWANLTLVADTLFAVAVLLIVASRNAGTSGPRLLGQSLVLLIIGGLFVHVFKQGLNIPRPPAVLAEGSYHLIGPKLKHESFPSGHSFTALSCFALIALNQARLSVSALLLALAGLAALSRAMVAAHWPLDIFVGGGFGILFAWLSIQLERRLAFFQSNGWRLFTLVLLTLASAALAFHDDRYPDTQLLSVIASIVAIVMVVRYYWLPLARLMRHS